MTGKKVQAYLTINVGHRIVYAIHCCDTLFVSIFEQYVLCSWDYMEMSKFHSVNAVLQFWNNKHTFNVIVSLPEK